MLQYSPFHDLMKNEQGLISRLGSPYLECRSQSQLLKDKRLNKYWAV